MQLHVHCCLVGEYHEILGENIGHFNLPHERFCDQFGIYVTKKLFSKEQIEQEIKMLIKQMSSNDQERLGNVKNLPPFNEDLTLLKTDLVKLTIPYKDQLINLWNNDKANSNEKSLLNYFENFEDLFQEA